MFWQMPILPVMLGTHIMTLPMHIFGETFSLVISMMVFAVVYAATEDRPAPVVVLGAPSWRWDFLISPTSCLSRICRILSPLPVVKKD